MQTLSENILTKLYLKEGKSAQEIANIFKCSLNKVRYWMKKYNIKSRSISDAVYLKNNPDGDPFKIKLPDNIQEAILYGFGLGLYWGEGTKADKNTVRLGNTDSDLIKKFIEFLIKVFSIKKEDLKFCLQIFNDINENKAIEFWTDKLKVSKNQFYKSIHTKSIQKGTYKKKSEYGVLTVYYHNKKMRDALLGLLEKSK